MESDLVAFSAGITYSVSASALAFVGGVVMFLLIFCIVTACERGE